MFLPPYRRTSSDRAGLRKAQGALAKSRRKNHRHIEAAIATALDAFTPSECANYFTNSGYKPDSFRNGNALACAWVDRRHDKSGWGATPAPASDVVVDFRFNDLADFVEAHRLAVSARPIT